VQVYVQVWVKVWVKVHTLLVQASRVQAQVLGLEFHLCLCQ
jgi:hypothetical protein